MRLVIQRVRSGRVSIGEAHVASIGRGYVILAAAAPDDTKEQAQWLGSKCAHLRLFEDDQGKMNRSLMDIGGEALIVSQFTLYADASKGRRPSFVGAAQPEVAEPLIETFVEALLQEGVPAKMGVFGAHMLVEIENDGPVTILIER